MFSCKLLVHYSAFLFYKFSIFTPFMFFVLRNLFYVAQISFAKPYKKFVNPDSEHYNRIKADEIKAKERKTNKSEGVESEGVESEGVAREAYESETYESEAYENEGNESAINQSEAYESEAYESEAKNRLAFDTDNMTRLPPADGIGNRKECHTPEDHLNPSTLKPSPSNECLKTPSQSKICLKRLTGRNQRQRNNGRSISNALKDYLREQWLRANWKAISKEIGSDLDEEIVNGEVDEETHDGDVDEETVDAEVDEETVYDGKVNEEELNVFMEAVEEVLEEFNSSELDNSEYKMHDSSTSAKDTSESETNTRSY